LKIFGLWGPTVAIFDSMVFDFGKTTISVWRFIQAAALFILLWAAAGAVNRFVAHRLAASDRLMTSDRVLLQRAIRAATAGDCLLVDHSRCRMFHLWHGTVYRLGVFG
jgi:hypothetical protein